jgi:hypothetical protein
MHPSHPVTNSPDPKRAKKENSESALPGHADADVLEGGEAPVVDDGVAQDT